MASVTRFVWVLVGFALAVSACSGEAGGTGDSDVADGTVTVPPDARPWVADAAPDSGRPPDAAPDVAPTPDGTSDAPEVPDAAVAEDAVEDAPADSGADAVPPADTTQDDTTQDGAAADDGSADDAASPDAAADDAASPDAAADTGDDSGEPGCGEADDEKVVGRPALATRIVNGVTTHDPSVVQLSQGQILAVGALYRHTYNWWNGTYSWDAACTVTVVGERGVLTAAHCVEGMAAEDLQVRLGVDSAAPVATLSVAEAHVHPDYNPRASQNDSARHDVAAIVLAEDVSAAAPDVRWIRPNYDPLPRTFTGNRVQNVGFGATTAFGWGSSNTKRWWTVESVTATADFEFTVYGGGESSVCFGDSGGPSLWTYPDGTIRVAGVVSWGDPSCVDYDHFARIDHNARWLAGVLPPSDLCAGESAEGRCEGDLAIWCDGAPASIRTADCAALGWLCATDDAGAAVCVPGDCDGLTTEGTCEVGDVAVWCDRGALRSRRCAPCGQICAFGEDGLGSYCRDPAGDSP